MENGQAFVHRSVLLSECIDGLNIKKDGIYIDGTAGGGGHSFEIAANIGDGGLLIAIDRDESAINAAGERLEVFGERAVLVRNNFSELDTVLDGLGIDKIDGILLDLGVSSYQLDTAERGFAYSSDAPLDMRMDGRSALTAYEVVNTYSEADLKRILFEYGEEKFSASIAAKIIQAREKKPIETTFELSELIKRAIPAYAREGGHHPAKRSFQAIRIEVNGELDAIEPAIRKAAARLNPGGRIVIITFHSLEDRIVKQTFASLAGNCTCPPNFPVCICNSEAVLRQVNKKPILPTYAEQSENPRSRSAKLRIAEKV